MDCICITKVSLRNLCKSTLRAKNTVSFNAQASCKVSSGLRQSAGILVGVSSSASGSFSLKPKNTHQINLVGLKQSTNFSIRSKYSFSGVFRSRLKSISNVNVPYTDKLGGSLLNIDKYINHKCVEKLYPTSDIIINSGSNYFVNQNIGTSNLYENINEGILSYATDEKSTFIQPSSISTEGTFKYKFGISNLRTIPKETLLLIRASAPFSDYSSNIAPIYKFSNITLEDPSGNLVAKYKDFVVRGDAEYDSNYVNFSTYVTEPEINNAALNSWELNYPVFSSGSILNTYKVNLDIELDCLGHQFTDGYDFGYESGCSLPFLHSEASNNNYLSFDGSPISTQKLNISNFKINNSLRITAIELCNSGELFTKNDTYLPFYTDVPSTGLRLTRRIFPDQFLTYNEQNNIHPAVSSVWQYSDQESNIYTNTTSSGALNLVSPIRNVQGATKLIYSSIADSGKLQLRFAHEAPENEFGYRDGAFSFSTNTTSSSFDMAEWSRFSHDHFFTIDKIELKVTAKKASGSRNYSLDIVGYSDDKLLNITSDVGGFLQNESGVQSGFIPTVSGNRPINDLSIAGEPISHRSQYFSTNATNNAGGDHYILSSQPVINSTAFQEYTIPLKIYQDTVALGKSKDYSMSSYFEKLYLDIYPIPSGAEISRIYLVVYYKPENAIHLHTVGSQQQKELIRRELNLKPTADYINSSGSSVQNLPHGYKSDETIKFNYSTRWKGISGNAVAGPFDPVKFDFGFENPELVSPFLNGHFSFRNDKKIDPSVVFLIPYDHAIMPDYGFGSTLLSSYTSGIYVGNYSKISNIGLRFKTESLFSSSTGHTSLDWTRIAGYENHELRGKLTDNFENAIRVSGQNGYIMFNDSPINSPRVMSSGFAIYTRFSPDINMSGVDYNLWNSGILFSNNQCSVGFSGGKLYGSHLDLNNNIISIHDTKYYYDYQYPLSVMLSYNENDNKLRLYSDRLVGESQQFTPKSAGALNSILFGRRINGFITNIGISTLHGPSGYPNNSGINILSSGNLNKRLKQDSYESIINKNLYSYIDEKVGDWHIGDFKICSFNQSYDRFTSRVGSDFILHYISSSGLAYQNTTNITLPSSISYNVSYHSQIENDSIRFALSDTNTISSPIAFAESRVSKTLPRGYQFEEEALAVDTILQHDTNKQITWNNGEVGPKLVVSLYSPNKDPSTYPTTNYGLVTRDTHYLKPSGCWQKITSIFDFNKLIDETEKWSEFNKTQYLKEFNHNYLSKDIDDMYLQYDLVYPSSTSFESSIKIHSANVRLKNAFVSISGTNDSLSLYSSGQAIRFDSLNVCMPNVKDISFNNINLSVSGKTIDTANNYINMYMSGVLISSNQLPLHTITIGTLNNFTNFGESVFGSADPYVGFNLYCSGQFFEQSRLPLFTQNNVLDQSSSGIISLFAYNKIDINNLDQAFNLYSNGFDNTSVFVTPNLNLYTEVTNVSNLDDSVNLFTKTFEILPNLVSGSCNLFTVNVPILNVQLGNQAISWDSQNVGVNIRVDDNPYSRLRANDEIRGVELICYGECK